MNANKNLNKGQILNGNQSLERELKQYFEQHQIPYDDNSGSFKKLDFGFGDVNAKRYFSFDAKEKRQHYSMKHWPAVKIPQEHLFILDDLAARKILAFAPNSGLLIRDITRQKYFFLSVVDLFLMPKQRVNREIKKNVKSLKGKWLIDLRNARMFETLAEVFAGIEAYLNRREDIFVHTLECYGEYVGEQIGQGGIERKPKHWSIDVKKTR